MRPERAGISTTMAGVAVIVVLVVAGAGGYFAGVSSAGVSTTTITSAGQGSTITSTSTSTSTSIATSTQVQTVTGPGGVVTVSQTVTAVLTSVSTSVSTSTSTSVSTALLDLEGAARAECPASATTCITIYSTQDPSNWATYYGPQFYTQFPWAQGKVNWISVSSNVEASRVLSEYQAKQVQADLVTGSMGVVIPIGLGGALINYTSPNLKFMNYTAGDYGPYWVATNRAIAHLVYNPTVVAVKSLPLPKTWSDLANPVYKGQIAFQTATALASSGSQFYYLYTQMGNASWTQLMQGIAANNPIITNTAAIAQADVVNGQAAIGIATFDDFVANQKSPQNASLKFIDIEPLTYVPGVLGITNGAAHPNMAKLVESWFISVSGQTGVVNSGRDPFMTPLAQPIYKYLPAGFRLTNAFANPAPLASTAATGQWSDIFKAIFGA